MQMLHLRRLLSGSAATAVVTASLLSATVAPGASAAELPAVPSASEARSMLSGLTVADENAMTGYSREKFPHWSSVGACSTRETVLKRDGSNVRVGADCYPTSGTWFSEYDRVTLSTPSEVDIDHMVPLAQAWRSGADSWTDARREQFAEDLTRPQLIAVSASSNRQKGDQDPAQWMPSNGAYHCTYVQAWVGVKSYWKLTVDAAEKAALTSTLNRC